ncbi:MAG: hypothetical protein KGL90_01565 [Burkholderiales bacterium]|nr:hypothetical protein [Burkholderiales bacterium]
MVQRSLKFGGLREPSVQEKRNHKALVLEKLGVIGGFLLGLLAGVNFIEAPLTQAGLPRGLVIAATVMGVAVIMRVGASLGAAAAERIDQARRG